MKRPDASVPVVVLTTSPNPLLHGSMGVVRSLGRLGVEVHAVHPETWTPADFSRYLRGKVTASLHDTARKRYLDDLLDVGRRLGRRSILLPIDDRGALFVVDHADTLKEWFRFPDQDPAVAHGLANKRELYRLCQRFAVPTAETVFPVSRDEVLALADQARFPIVLKAMDPLVLARQERARSVVIARNRSELLDAYDHMGVAGEPNLMLQEYIPGTAASVWMFNGYFDDRSECLVAFTGTKLRQCPPHTGAASLGVCRRNPVVERTTRELLGAIGYKGIVDIGYRYDPRDRRYKLLDVNPRIGATFRLFVARDGMDVARALYLDLTGQPVPPSTARDGRKWVVEHNDLLASRRYHRAGELSLGAWARSFRGVREAAWFSWADPAPFVAMCWWSLRLAARRSAREATARPNLNAGKAQRLVTERFETHASFWQDVYQRDDVPSVIYQHRHRLALDSIDRLGLPAGSRVLEAGSGAGYMAVALAERGFRVDAMDVAQGMLEISHQRATEAKVAMRVRHTLGDVHRLPFADGTFDLVVALGVVPWLHSPELAVAEMVRVVRPGGYLLVSADNRGRLEHVLDPLHNPALQPARDAAKVMLGAVRVWRPRDHGAVATSHRLAELDEIVASAGLERCAGATFGFGPFTVLGRPVLPKRLGVRAHAALQQIADRGVAIVRSTGSQYLVLAHKPLPVGRPD